MAATPAPARACLCARVEPFRIEMPVDGARDWPVDAGLWVGLFGSWPEPAVAAITQDYRLRGPDGDVVVLMGQAEGRHLSLRPLRPLAPDTTYTIERLFPYGDGYLLTDRRLVEVVEAGWPPPAGLPDELVRAWFPTGSFRTASASPPRWRAVAPRVTSAQFDVVQHASMCGPGEALEVRFTTEAPAGSSVGIEVEGQGVVWREPVNADLDPTTEWSAETSDTRCSDPKVHVDVSGPPRVRAVVWGPSGDRVVASDWTQASRVVGPASDPVGAHVPREPDRWHRVRAWWAAVRARARMRSFAIVDAHPMPAASGCEGGLVGVGERVARSPWRWSGQLSVREGRWWAGARADDEPHTELVAVEVTPGAPTAEPVPLGEVTGFVAVADPASPADPSAAPFVTWAPVAGGGGSRVARAARDGTVRWERTIQRMDAVVAGAGRVLVRSQGRRGEYATRTPYWTLLDADSGAVVGSGELGEATRDGVTTWDGEAFLLATAWTREDAARGRGSGFGPPGNWLTVVGPDGDSQRLPIAGESPVQRAARVSDGWVLVAGGVRWVDSQGVTTAGPHSIPAAALGSVSSLVVRDGIAFLAGDGPLPGSDDRLVAVDRVGGISAPRPLPSTSGIELAHFGDRLVGVFGDLEADPDRPGWGRWVLAAQELTCTSTSPTGPPPRIRR